MATKKPAPKAAKPKVSAKGVPAKKAPIKAPAKKKPARPTLTPARVAAHAKGRVKRESEGRPSKWKPEFIVLAFKFCLMGATDKRLSEFFDVSEATVNAWKAEHPEFLESICKGREIADADIAHSLYHRAKGYSHDEVDIRTVALGGNAGSELVITPITKHYPPDTAAASLWLRNRAPRLWRDKVDVEHSGGLTLQALPDLELQARYDELQARMAAAK